MIENTEIWKPVVGYEGLYEVSSFGRVRSLDKMSADGRRIKGKILKGKIDKGGYLLVTLCKDKKQTTYKVHRLVAEHFIPNPQNKPCIDHINTVRTDNRVENVRWATYKENGNNPLTKIKQSRILKGKYGKEHPASKPIIQYDKDGNFIKEWDSIIEAARELGVNGSSITLVCQEKPHHKTAYGFIWKYKNAA